jgi:hypothetical protein
MHKRMFIVCAIAVCSLVSAQVAPRRSSIVVVKDPAAKEDLDVEQFRLSLRYLQEELGQSKTEPPGVLVLCLTKQTAGALGIGDGIYLQRTTEPTR